MHGAKDSSTETHKSFPLHYGLMRGKFLKRILTCLHCNKCNKIDRWHLDTQKRVSFKKCYKYYKYSAYRITQKCYDPMGANV